MLWPFLLVSLFFVGIVWLAWTYLRERRTVKSSLHFIPTSVHGGLDYLMGLLLIALPWLFGFAANEAETWVLVVLGGGLLLYSLCTDYEWGLVRRIPMPLHLVLDGLGGLFLFASPFLFGFADEVMDPYLGLGLLEIVVALVTQPVPSRPNAASGAEHPATPERRAGDEPPADREAFLSERIQLHPAKK